MLTTNCTTSSRNLLVNKIIHASIVFMSFSFSARYAVASGTIDMEEINMSGTWGTSRA